jgi:hypothetical protein
MVKKTVKSNILAESKISWAKIGFAIIAGIVLGYFIFGSNLIGMDFNTIVSFVILCLLACILALLLDLRKIMMSNFGKC